MRMMIAKKKVADVKWRKYNEKVNEQLTTYSSTILNFNSRKLPPFQYGFEEKNNKENKKKEFRGSIEIEKGSFYFGEWIEDTRHGKGIMNWSDGSKFEGYFKFNKANGRGRLINANGEIYEGDWKV